MKRRSFLQAGAGAPAVQLVNTQGAPAKEKFTPISLARHYNASSRDFGPRPWARNILHHRQQTRRRSRHSAPAAGIPASNPPT